MAGEYKEAILNIKENFKQDNESIKNEDLLNDLTELLLDEVNQNFINGTFEGYNVDLDYKKAYSNLGLFRHSMYLAKLKNTSFGNNLVIGYWVAPPDFRRLNGNNLNSHDGNIHIDENNINFRPTDMVLIGRSYNDGKGFYLKALHLDDINKRPYENFILNMAFRRNGKRVMFGKYCEEKIANSISENAKLELSDVSENELVKDHDVAAILLSSLYQQIMNQNSKKKFDAMACLFKEEYYKEKNDIICKYNDREYFRLPDLGE